MGELGADADLARVLATEAAGLLLRVRRQFARADATRRGDEGDRQAQAFLARRLAEARPDDAVLSEESLDDRRRLQAARVWIIDPLDGTREFAELDRKDWAVHVALWQSGDLVAGAVALPAQGLTLCTHDVRCNAPTARSPRILVSRTRPPALASFIARALSGELVPMGSAGAKVAAIIQGGADVYVHAGGQHEWDSAAPVAVARAAGLHTSRIDGSPLQYNRPDPLLPDLLVCRQELAPYLIDSLREWGKSGR